MEGRVVVFPLERSDGKTLPLAGVAMRPGALPGATCSSSLSEPTYWEFITGVLPPEFKVSSDPDCPASSPSRPGIRLSWSGSSLYRPSSMAAVELGSSYFSAGARRT